MKSIRLAYCELTLAMAIVGSSIVVGKLVVASFPVFLASALRFGCATLVLIPLLLWREKGFPRLTPRDWLWTFLQTVCGVFLFSIFLLNGLKLTSASQSGIISASTPAVLGLISFFFLRERLTRRKSLGILLSMCGVLAINLIGAAGAGVSGANALLGNLLVFGAVVGEALFSVFGKLVSPKVSPLTTTTLMSAIGFLLFSPFALIEAQRFDFRQVGVEAWLPVLYYAIVVTVIGFLLWFNGLAKVPASTAAVFTGVWPVSALLLSYLVLGEPFDPSHLLGMGCVLGGILLIASDGGEAAEPAGELTVV